MKKTLLHSNLIHLLLLAGGMALVQALAWQEKPVAPVSVHELHVPAANAAQTLSFPDLDTTFSCLDAPGKFEAWFTSVTFQVSTFAASRCDSFRIDPDYSMNPPVLAIGCGEQDNFYTFAISDTCGTDTTLVFNFRVINDQLPVINGVPANDIIVACAADLPLVPVVSATAPCSDLDTLIFEERILSASCSNGTLIRRSWIARDTCLKSVTRSYEILIRPDTLSPQLIGVPDDTLVLCQEEVPAPATVTAVDECSGTLDSVSFRQQEIGGQCPDQRTILRIWEAADTCNNIARDTQLITVRDTLFPTFTVPANITISCEQDPDSLQLTGEVLDAKDNCGEVASIDYTDRADTVCLGSYQIVRTWAVTDSCNNTTFGDQIITVTDSQAPTFNLPPDTTLDCGLVSFGPEVAGFPTNLMDNCGVDSLRFEDKVNSPTDTCQNRYTIERSWFLVDQCGNSTGGVQVISVIDTLAPVFNLQPRDTTLFCTQTTLVDAAFERWINNYGGARATDNGCTPADQLIWEALDAETGQPATLSSLVCADSVSVLREADVLFVARDGCGNRDTARARFQLIDDVPPVLSNCPQDVVLPTDSGICAAAYTLLPPLIDEDCGLDTVRLVAAATDTLQPSGGGDPTVLPVAEVRVQLPLPGPLPVNADGPGILAIGLRNADGEDLREHLIVEGEDGSVLGITAPTDVQCGDSDTTLTLSIDQLNGWAQDGVIELVLKPNLPLNPEFAINAICNGVSTVETRLSFARKNLNPLTYQYQLNDDSIVDVPAVEPVDLLVPLGENRITIYVTDCGGNVDSCMHTVTVEDREQPVIECPANVVVALDSGQCSRVLTLPLPTGATDNCSIGEVYDVTLPVDTGQAYWQFNYNPNLLDYVAQPKLVTFSNTAANAVGEVTLQLDFRGNFDDANAYFRIVSEDGSAIDSTAVGDAACDRAGTKLITIPDSTFNRWAADGSVQFELAPRFIMVPPGVAGDGVNPCDTAFVQNDGDVDSVSFVFARLSYGTLTPTYFTQGALEIPPTAMIPPMIAPEIDFPLGATEVFYVLADDSGNTDTCSFLIEVRDEEPPTVLCQPTTLFLNPSGLDIQAIDLSDLDAGSFDNCTIDTLFISPDTVTCNMAGMPLEVTLTVVDQSGNSANCTSLVRIETLEPQPSANSGVCGNDTLFLQANPPPAMGGTVFTYLWTGPGGFSSNLRNPVIPNVSSENAGSYVVRVTGLTGCQATGVVQVSIEDLPLTPSIQGATSYCIGEDILLTSSVAPNDPSTQYKWFQGTLPNGTLIETTIVPSLTIPGLDVESTRNYYLVIETNDCDSRPSAPLSVTVNSQPIAAVNEESIDICAGETIVLGTETSGPGFTYEWSGPNGYFSDSQFPPVIENATSANAGTYRLVVFRNGCPSEPDFTSVIVRERPVRPQIANDGPACEGGSVTLSANATGDDLTYHWVPPNLAEFTTSTNQTTIENITPEQAGPWRAYVSRRGCASELSAITEVEVFPLPNIVASATPGAVCQGETLQLQASPSIDNATYQWSGPNNFSAASQNPAVPNMRPINEGTYSVTVTTIDGCVGTAQVGVEVQRPISIQAISNDAPACLQAPRDVRLQASVFPEDDGTFEYLWTGPNGYTSTQRVAIIANATEANNGNYQLQVTDGNGCTSAMATTVVDISDAPQPPDPPQLSPSTPAPICMGEAIRLQTRARGGDNVEYRWKTPNGNFTTTEPFLDIPSATNDDAGEYQVSVRVAGCASLDSNPFLLEVNDVPIAVVSSNSPVCSGTTIQLEAEEIPGASYVWTGPGFISSMRNPVINDADSALHSGIYTLVMTVEGCTSAPVSVQIDIVPSPTRPVASSNGPVCVETGDEVLRLAVDAVSATENALYTWFDESGPIGSTRDLVFDVPDLTQYPDGEQMFYVTAQAGFCVSEASRNLIIPINFVPDNDAFAGADAPFCENEVITLNAQAPSVGTGRWSFVGDDSLEVQIANPDQPATTVNGLNGGQSYTFRWSLSNGVCTDYTFDDVVIDVSRVENANAGTDITGCALREVQLGAEATVDAPGRWEQSQVQELLGVEIADPTDPNTLVTGLEPGNLYTFTWRVNSTCGQLLDEVLVLSSDPDPFAGPDQTVCNRDRFAQLAADPPSEGSRGRWSSADAAIRFGNAGDPGTVVTNLRTGTNTLIWTIDNGICGDASRDTVVINFKQTPLPFNDAYQVSFGESIIVDFTENDSVPPNTTVGIVLPPQRGQIRDLGNGRFEYLPDINFVGTDQLIYELCSDACQCVEAVATFEVGGDASCTVPNIITPNNDGINDVFAIPCLLDENRFPNSQVIVFSRWGDEVFRSERPYKNQWGGTFNGEDLPTGTYYYIVNFGDGRTPDQNGYLIIQR